MSNFYKSLPFQLLIAILIGSIIGLFCNESIMMIIVTINYILGQFINFCVPLIIIGFVTPSITKLGEYASKLLGYAIIIAYLSSIGAAIFAMSTGYLFIPRLTLLSNLNELNKTPDLIFRLDIPQIMGVMSALVFAILIGLAAIWTKAHVTITILNEFQTIILSIVTNLVIPILPFFIATTFCNLAYEGTITKQLPVFLQIIGIVIVEHFIWLIVLYTIAGIYSKQNPIQVIRYYAPAYLTAVGTMSSAATLSVSLKCAKKSPILRNDMIDFGIPLFSNIHLCGSVLTETFFVMVVSKMLYGTLPQLNVMLLFCILLGVFAIGAPGVPGGTVMASLGLITSVLGFQETGTALMLSIFALQDSFGTACNVTGDGALTLLLSKFVQKHSSKEQTKNNPL